VLRCQREFSSSVLCVPTFLTIARPEFNHWPKSMLESSWCPPQPPNSHVSLRESILLAPPVRRGLLPLHVLRLGRVLAQQRRWLGP
jgi:hypothetical protein